MSNIDDSERCENSLPFEIFVCKMVREISDE